MRGRRSGLIVVLVLGGCALHAPPPARTPEPERRGPAPVVAPASGPATPIERRPSVSAESSAAQARSPVEAATVTPAHVGPAALALLEQARLQAAAGDGERAAATLERALRIEADNPWLWHRLGVLRLQQGLWDQAIALALRSNGFARGNARLLGGNWRVIAEARAGQGDHAGAQAALRQARTYLGPSSP